MANENNIPNEISLPGTLTGRHESSLISPMGFSAFSTNMKSDIAPMSTLSFTTNFKSDVSPIPFANFATAMKSDIPTISSVAFSTRLQSDISPMGSILGSNNISSNTAPMTSILGANNEASNTAPMTSILGANNQLSNTAPMTSILGANNEASNTAPMTSILGANNEASTTAPINSTLTGRFDTSDIAPLVSQLTGRFDTSDTTPVISTLTGRFDTSVTAPTISTLTGRHESSGIDDAITQLAGRFDTSDTAPIISTLTGRFDSSDTAPIISTLTGRHESSGVDDGITTLSGRHESSAVNDSWNQDIIFPIQQVDLSPYAQLGTANWLGDLDTAGFTIQNSVLDTQFKGIAGQSYNYPNSKGLGFGLVDSSQGVNFLDIPNQDAQGFTTFFDTGTPTQFKGATAGDYTYPDNHGLGYGLIGNSLFSNIYPTPYTTPLFPDGFVQNQPIEESQFSLESFAGGGKIGLETEGFKHSTFGGVQGQVPIMGNNPTGLGEFTSGGNTSGDIGIVNAFDDTTSGAKGFTPQMFDLALPKTQFNGVAGTPGSLTYEYPTDVGPAGIGRLMYDVPFADAGNPYGGAYTSHLAAQIPVNPSITINKQALTDTVNYSFYKAGPSGLAGIVDTDPARPYFNEGSKYSDIISNFTTDILINAKHPGSFLGDFASREGSPTPLDNMKVLIPANTGPVGAASVTAKYTHVDGYPNYNTQNLSYSSAGVANQREGFVRNELFARTIDYDTDGTYGHDLQFGGTGDDPKGLKSYKKPHIIRDIGKKWNGFSNEGTPFDEGAFRGGFLTLGNRALLDVVRNTKHIISDPIKGLLWGLKQIGLQASNPKVETEMAFLGRRTRVFNLGIGLLANMLTGPFGIKLYRHGLLNGIGEDKSTYETAVKAHGGINPYDADRAEFGPAKVGKGGRNRLMSLKDELHFGASGNGAGGFLGLGNLLGFTGQKIDLLSDTAFGGPKSLYGIGGTTIRRYYNAGEHLTGEPLESSQDEGQGGRSSLLAKYSTISHYGLALASDNREGFESSATDFREDIFEEIGGTTSNADMLSLGDSYTFPYSEFSRDAKFGYTPYTANRDRNFLPLDGEDQNFALDHGMDEYIDFDQDYGDVQTDEIDGKRDMIKLMVEDIPASTGGTKKIVRFRSYLSEISDTISPDWQKNSYVGRPDQVHSYSGASREVSFTLKFASLSRFGMVPMYKKINYLYGLAYPHYDSTTPNQAFRSTMIAPLIKLTMGDWLYRCPGYFNSIATTVDNDYPWEINLEQEATRVAQLPQIVSVALGFTVIGDGPHMSGIFGKDAALAGIHIGGGVSPETAEGTFFAELPIE